MSWNYLGDHWWEVAYWHFRSRLCDQLGIRCPSCVEGKRIEAMTEEEFENWIADWMKER